MADGFERYWNLRPMFHHTLGIRFRTFSGTVFGVPHRGARVPISLQTLPMYANMPVRAICPLQPPSCSGVAPTPPMKPTHPTSRARCAHSVRPHPPSSSPAGALLQWVFFELKQSSVVHAGAMTGSPVRTALSKSTLTDHVRPMGLAD